MELRETQESLTRQFVQMVYNHCKLHQLFGSPFGGSGTRHHLKFGKKSLFGSTEIKWDRSNLKIWVGPEEAFENGNWVDLEIRIFDSQYLECASQLSIEYERKTGKKITLLKEF